MISVGVRERQKPAVCHGPMCELQKSSVIRSRPADRLVQRRPLRLEDLV